MAKKINKKLALKKETLRSLSEAELGAVAGGTLYGGSDKGASFIKPPPPATLGCTTDALIQLQYYQYYP